MYKILSTHPAVKVNSINNGPW